MLKLMDTTERMFTPSEAERVAAEMQAADPDWRYVVRHDPKGTGYSFIEVYDEDGNLVSKV